jgi:hypothetical protein
MDRYPEPADRDEAYAEMRQEGLSIHDENWMTANTNEINRREKPEEETELPPEPGTSSDEE